MNSPVTQTAPPQESSFWEELSGNSPVENQSAAEETPSQSHFDSSDSDFFSLENFTAPLRWARNFFSDEASPNSLVESFPDFEPPPGFSLSYYYDYTKKAVQYTLDAGEKFLLGTPSPVSWENQPGLMPARDWSASGRNQAPTYPYSLKLDLSSHTETVKPKVTPEVKSTQPHQPIASVPIVPVYSIPIGSNSSFIDYAYFSYTPERIETEIKIAIDDETVIPILAPVPVPAQFVFEEIFQMPVVIPAFVTEIFSALIVPASDLVSDVEENLQPDLNQPGSFVRTVVLEPRENEASLTTLSFVAPMPIKEGGAKVLSKSAMGHAGPRKIGTPAFLEKNRVDVSQTFFADEITALSHQSTIVKPSSPLIFDFDPVGSDGKSVILSAEIPSPEILSPAVLAPAILSSAILSPAMLALKRSEERAVEAALLSGFVYIHGGMVSLFSSRDEWSGRVTDTLHAEHRAHVLATVSAGSRSGQEDRQQKQGQDNSVLYQLLTSA